MPRNSSARAGLRCAVLTLALAAAAGCPPPDDDDNTNRPPRDDAGTTDERDAGVDGGTADAGGDDGGVADGGTGNPDAGPGGLAFAGIAQAYADGTTELVVTWIEAVDDTTAPADLVYRVYAGATEGEVVDAADDAGPANATATGVTTTRLTGLVAGQTVVVLAIAVDADGNVSAGRRVVTVVMPQAPLVQRAPLIDLATLDVTCLLYTSRCV